MKLIRLLIISSLMVVAFGCSTVSYQYDYDPEVNYTGLKTFNWITLFVQEDIYTLNDKRIQEAVNTQLEVKGCKMTTDNPDFLIAMDVTKEEKTEVRTWDSGYGGYGGYGVRAMLYGDPYMGNTQFDVYEYEEGTFILDFVDPESMELIWRGIAQGELRNYSTPAERYERIDEIVQKVLSNFPPAK